ncbi:MAG: ribonuclease P protein component [Chlamydiae bacterium]|jgi:ribonuclease P protein component|nr:ribonuclease P protein component [Chlamydiota bacterium]
MDSEQEWLQKQGEQFSQEEELEAATSLPYRARSLSKNDFTLLKVKGTKVFGSSVKFCYMFCLFEGLGLGITAFKKGGNAVQRNYFKRLVREVFRKIGHTLPTGIKIQVLPHAPLEKISYHTILEDVQRSLCTSILNKKEPSKQLKDGSLS